METNTRSELMSKNQIRQYFHIHRNVSKNLFEEASRDPALNAICSLLAIRERSRSVLTMRNTNMVMLKEGYNFTISDYDRCFRFMASLGIGTLDVDSKGVTKALKNIKYSLPNLGLAGLGRSIPPNKILVAPSLPPKIKPFVQENQGLVEVRINVLGHTVSLRMTPDKAQKYLVNLLGEVSHGKG